MASERRIYTPNDEVWDMTIGQLLQNPTGWGSAAVGNRERIKKDLADRFQVLMVKAKGEIVHQVYTDGDDFVVHLRVPSETIEGLKYDVVLRLHPETADQALSDYRMTLFSNSPHFVFTYAYVLNQKGSLEETVKGKMSSKALDEEPKIRNPIETWGFEKSTYFACLYLRHSMRTRSRNAMAKDSLKLNRKLLLANVKTSEAKMVEYKQKEKEAKEARKSKKAAAAGRNATRGLGQEAGAEGRVGKVREAPGAAGRQVKQSKSVGKTGRTQRKRPTR
jgi:hypothetical protein